VDIMVVVRGPNELLEFNVALEKKIYDRNFGQIRYGYILRLLLSSL
jgi:hypothetical protein